MAWQPWGISPTFNFNTSLERLQEGSRHGFLHLQDIALKERNNLPIFSCAHYDSNVTKCIDLISNSYLKQCKVHDCGVPYSVSEDGSCLFNAVSLAICGSEKMSTELRVRTCIEMVSRKDVYSSLPIAKNLIWVAPNYISSALDCAQKHGWSSIWTILALAEVIGIPIESIYLPLNGVQDLSYKTLNLLAVPRKCKDENVKITVMWTRNTPHNSRQIWVPNHFVPLLKLQTLPFQSTPLIDDLNEFPDLVSTHSSNETTSTLSESTIVENDSTSKISQSTMNIEDSVTTENIYDPSTDITQSSNCDSTSKADGHLTNTFLGISEVFTVLTKAVSGTTHIPGGLKENVYYVIDNSKNLNKSDNKRSDFSDDCGTWESSKGTSPTAYFDLRHPELKQIFIREGLYCTRKQKDNKKVFVALEPQPSSYQVCVIHRYYAVHKNNNKYKKKVTWIGKGGIECKFALVEYLGKFPGLISHGNSKTSNEYTRTPQFVMDEITTLTGKQKPHQIYNHLLNKYDELTQPTSLRQVHDKQRWDRLKRESLSMCKDNYADQMRHIENMVTENDEFVRAVIRTNGKSPCVVLYTDEQLTDLKNICCNGDAVLGVDKTFMLCNMYVTVSCYKQISVNRVRSGEHPVFLGPMYIHDNSDFDTFSHFFHHLKIKLMDSNLARLVIGTDDEKALVKAISHIIPECTHVLCTRHLEENCRHILTDDAVTLKQRQTILKDIFGPDGLIDSDDTICFNEKCDDISKTMNDVSDKFLNYFNKRLKGCLQEKVMNPIYAGKVNRKWTNNNCESMNHVLKQTVDWKSKKLPEFVRLAHELVKAQYKGLRSALVGTGDYRLSDSHMDYLKTKSEWTIMTDKQRQNHYRRFRSHIVRNNRLVTSKDGHTVVLEPKTKGKKPCQRKRKPKTTTISIKKPRTTDISL